MKKKLKEVSIVIPKSRKTRYKYMQCMRKNQESFIIYPRHTFSFLKSLILSLISTMLYVGTHIHR
jgi:hypothetical protein